ncbi:hypothetical protein [Paenibacillus xylanexedens]|nr:hypothetical protein [Paenibacillus xylanexedens]
MSNHNTGHITEIVQIAGRHSSRLSMCTRLSNTTGPIVYILYRVANRK